MKKLIILFAFILSGLLVTAQSSTVWHNAPQLAAVTLNGTGTGTITFPIVMGEYDVSLQLIPALAGAGSDLTFSHIVYQSNSAGAAVWTALSAADTVSTVTDADGLYEITDFQGMRLKVICTGIGSDTSTVTPYWVYKKHAQE